MKKVILASIVFVLSWNVQAANIVVNGSFESPELKAKTWKVFQSIDGWSTVGAGIEIRNNVAGSAYEGNQFAELDSHGKQSNSSISQTLSTMLGKVYKLSFAYSPRIKQPEDTNGIDVFWNGNLLQSISGAGSKVHDWLVYSFMVQGTGKDVLAFEATGKQDTLGGSLDDVSVSAVPIPAAALLFAPALLGLIGLRRRAVNA
jgi:hypothetical protein